MSRCEGCEQFIWPWQARGPRILGSLHRTCWRTYYERVAERIDAADNTTAFWDAVLMSPPDISAELLKRHDRAQDARWAQVGPPIYWITDPDGTRRLVPNPDPRAYFIPRALS